MHIHDVLIIGAGPCGLAVAARLREKTPSATFTDDEHQRYHWIRKHGRKMTIKNYRKNIDSLPISPITTNLCDSRPSTQTRSEDIDMLILDADGANWMSKWKRLFKTFGIKHLRSPMFFHVDPADRDGLLGYTYEKDRECDLLALPGCAGKELSKHRKKKKLNARNWKVSQSGPDVDERDRKDYYTPSSALFEAHCDEVAKRYGLESDLVRQEKVVDIDYDNLNAFQEMEHRIIISDDALDEDRKIFCVRTDKGVRYAHVVVLAIGPGNAPSIPQVEGLFPCSPHEGYAHALHLKQFPPPHVIKKIKMHIPTHILIVGGGLTSIQLADLALKRGVSKVWLLMRGDVKVKYFDIELDWVGKFRNFNQAAFWSADTDEERLEMYLQARNGGSITPRYRKILNEHIASGKMELHTHTTLRSINWDSGSQTWPAVVTTPSNPLPPIDFIIFATGVQSDIEGINFLDKIRKRHPIPYAGGFPCLNDDLMWSDDLPLFINGRFAGLRLGPGAPNLVGVRVGAERIAWNIQDVLERIGRGNSEYNSDLSDESDDTKLAEFTSGRRNRFDSLHDVESA